MAGRSPDGSGQPGLRPEPVSRLGHSATVPNADEFARLIRHTLAEHPRWLPDAIQALFHGSQLAMEELNRLRAQSDAACLAALALCDAKRITPELRTSLLGTITKPMHAPNLCELERKFAAQAIEARRAETLQDGSVHESAVGAADAPNPGQSSGMPKGGEL
jgi:hypothetical protein